MKLYIDGSCNPNPGVGTIGIYGDNIRCGLKLSNKTTNNQMEYLALLAAIKIGQFNKVEKLTILTDSSILDRTFKNKNFSSAGRNPILSKIREEFIKQAGDSVEITWVRREENTGADKLTKLAHSSDIYEGLELNKEELKNYLTSFII